MRIMVTFTHPVASVSKQHVALNISPTCVQTEGFFLDADLAEQAYYNADDESAYFLTASRILSWRYGVAKTRGGNTDIAFLGD